MGGLVTYRPLSALNKRKTKDVEYQGRGGGGGEGRVSVLAELLD